VELLALVGRGGRVRVRHCQGDLGGLEEFVATRQLVCRLSQLRAVLRDVERLNSAPAPKNGGDIRSPFVCPAA
jgi:hypothetical protein